MHCFYSIRLLRHYVPRKDALLLSLRATRKECGNPHTCHCERPKGARQSRPCTAFILSDCFVTAFLAKTHPFVTASDPKGEWQSTHLSLRATKGRAAISSVHSFSCYQIASSLRSSQRHSLLSLRVTRKESCNPHTYHCERPKGARQSRPCTAFILSDCFVSEAQRKPSLLNHTSNPAPCTPVPRTLHLQTK